MSKPVLFGYLWVGLSRGVRLQPSCPRAAPTSEFVWLIWDLFGGGPARFVSWFGRGETCHWPLTWVTDHEPMIAAISPLPTPASLAGPSSTSVKSKRTYPLVAPEGIGKS